MTKDILEESIKLKINDLRKETERLSKIIFLFFLSLEICIITLLTKNE